MADATPDLIKRPVYPTALGRLQPHGITLLGQDLAEDVMGTVGFGELAFWLATQRKPTRRRDTGLRGRARRPGRSRLHPHGDRDPADVPVSAGLDSGRVGRRAARRRLAVPGRHRRLRPVPARRAQRRRRPASHRRHGWDALALDTVTRQRDARSSSRGWATTCTKKATPAPRGCSQIAAEEDLFGPHLSLFAAIGRVHPEVLGKTLPLNGAGVCGAALADLSLPLELLRGFALLARTAGLIGQLAEELRHPVANEVFLSVDLNNRSVDPDPYPPTVHIKPMEVVMAELVAVIASTHHPFYYQASQRHRRNGHRSPTSGSPK